MQEYEAKKVTERPPPAAALRQLIAEKRRSVTVLAAGLGPVLDVLDAYVVATQCELFELRKRIEYLEGGK